MGQESGSEPERPAGRYGGERWEGAFMAKPLGIVTRYRTHLEHFDVAFWEAKDVGGACRPPVPGTIPMVSFFGDNRVAGQHPDWVQQGPGGERGARPTRYFDWDTLCPSRPEVAALALRWAEAALSGAGALRLDDVTFARRGYCTCSACQEGAAAAGLPLEAWRQRVLSNFVAAVRERAGARPLYLTLYPDPYPGHLARERGLDLQELAPLVDAFVVPLYDLAYSTTYWLEVLASGFRDLLGPHPWWAELYALGVPTPALTKAALVAGTYADGVLLAYGAKLPELQAVAAAVQKRFGESASP